MGGPARSRKGPCAAALVRVAGQKLERARYSIGNAIQVGWNWVKGMNELGCTNESSELQRLHCCSMRHGSARAELVLKNSGVSPWKRPTGLGVGASNWTGRMHLKSCMQHPQFASSSSLPFLPPHPSHPWNPYQSRNEACLETVSLYAGLARPQSGQNPACHPGVSVAGSCTDSAITSG